MKVLLVFPPHPKNKGELGPSYLGQQYSFLYPPLGLLYLASNIDRTRHEVKILDSAALRLSITDCVNFIKEFEPDVLGMTVLTNLLYSAKVIAEGAKAALPNMKVVFGGPHVNIYPYETLAFPGVDFCLQHFGEYSMNMLIEAIDNNSGYQNVPGLFYKSQEAIRKSDKPVNYRMDLDSLKMPDRRLLDYSKYFTVVDNNIITTAISSRGCPSQCTFCDILQKKYLYRSPGNVIEEIKDIVSLGIKTVHFFDDTFNLVRERVIEFCELLLKENIKIKWSFRGRVTPIDDEMAKLLYAAGCRRVQLGVESSSEKTLKIIKKNISLEEVKRAICIYKKNRILTMGYFMVGFPHENLGDCMESLNVAAHMGFDYLHLAVLTPYPNTEIYSQLLKEGAPDHWIGFARNPQDNYSIPVMHPSIDRKTLDSLVDKAYRKFYFSPKFVFEEIKRINNLKALVWKAKAVLKIVSTVDY